MRLTKTLAFFLIGLLYFSVTANTQETIPVTIKVLTQKKEPVTYASIYITNRADTNNIIIKAADSTGSTVFQLLKDGQYTVRISSINYQTIEKGISITGNKTIFSFTAEPLGKTLEAAVVVSKKTIYEAGR